MLDDDSIDADWLASLGLDELVPASLAHWRPLAAEAMSFFLDRLSPDRLAAMFSEQSALGVDASGNERLVRLLAQCPTLHKLGQVLARQPRLDPVLRRHLQSLESMPATASLEPILGRLRDELGSELPGELDPHPLAEGSVAVVLPFRYRDEQGAQRHGVFKVLRPGIEARLADELAALPDLATFIERRAAELGLPRLDFRDTLASVERLLRQEIRLDREQLHLRAARRFYRDEPGLLVPALLPWCTPRVTAMERVFGTKLNEAELSAAQRPVLAATLVRTLLAKPFWTRLDPAMFHGDLHGGNLLATEDGRIAVLDWSLVARVTKRDRERLVAIALGGITLDSAQIRQAMAELARCPFDDPVLVEVVERALDALVLESRVPGFDWLLALLDEFALARATAFPADLAVFRKSWLTLSGVLHDLAGPVAADVPLIDAGLRQFVGELPARWVAPPSTRSFSTHVSNADLAGFFASAWLAGLRYGLRARELGLQGLRQLAGGALHE
ncbi:MAG TPA: AarF/ABC1/UbiB kinase family protein [Aromatoleum sp.]|uniref:AarF/ABC1/UbiB kinase family protein n=1 Tax=Aromatoleum sp. TaxID=2307007 RepID=UPI002B4710DB|nr:AarF/ABC1/UbiB kinase family protein [Aromatoleum sp.]HJV24205.1 AarF/ABC1/UbiB kinase family protein [Aromatoleum sp.]